MNAQHAIGWSLVTERRFAEAEEQMKVALRLAPSDRRARANLARLQLRRGAVEEAIAGYRGLSTPVPGGSAYDAPASASRCGPRDAEQRRRR